MLTIHVGQSISDLWELYREALARTVSSRTVIVLADQKPIGIITDADLRKFFAREQRMPETLNEVMRKDFVLIDEDGDNRQTLALSVLNQLNSRGNYGRTPIQSVVLCKEGKYRIEDIEEFRRDLEAVSDRHIFIGLGYVGLTLMAVSNRNGWVSIGIDNDLSRIQNLEKRQSHVKEPNIERLLFERGEVSFFESLEQYTSSSWPPTHFGRQIFFVCVNTPVNTHHQVSTDSLSLAAESISRVIQKGDIVILRSTLPIGGLAKFGETLRLSSSLTPGLDFSLGYCPERTAEGVAIYEIEHLPQIVAGITFSCSRRISEIMSRFCRTIIVANNPGEAELAKLANNAFRDVCFGFSNEIAQIAIQNLIDVNSSIELANQGYSRGGIPSPSPGVGGPCLSKDSWILIEAKKNEIDQISGIRHFRLQNLMMPKVVTDMIVSILKNHLNVTLGKLEVLVIGLAFKGEPETNDLRNSSSLEICKNLSQEGLSVFVHDSVIDTRHLSEFNYEAAKVNQIFQVIVIANNHRNNLNIAGSYVSRTENSLVFDLWELSRSSEQKDLRFPSSTIVIGLSGNVISGKS